MPHARRRSLCRTKAVRPDPAIERFGGSNAARRREATHLRRSAIGRGSLVQHDAQEFMVHLEAAVVLDEAELPKLVHEEIDA